MPYISNPFNFNPLATFTTKYPIYDNVNNFVTLNTLIPDTFVSFQGKHYFTNSTPPERLTTNDTISHIQRFEDYYSYDDGSAEVAYGINLNGSVAVKYVPQMADTIIGAYIYFAPVRNDVRDFGFFLTLWSSLDPEEVTYRNFDFSYPKYIEDVDTLTGLNKFLFYQFDEPIFVDNEFYIGYTKPETNPLNIGFDRNNIATDKLFFSLSPGIWQGSSQAGALMFRPVYKSEVNLLNIDNINQNKVVSNIFPNPSNSGMFNILLAEPMLPHSVFVYNQQGKLLFTKEQFNNNTLDLSTFTNGLYFVEFLNRTNGNRSVSKIIIQ